MRIVKIKNVLFSPGIGGFFFDDQAAIRTGLKHDGFLYDGESLTPGYDRVHVPA